MPSFKEIMQEIHKRRPPSEDSIPFRVSVLCTVMTGIIACLSHLEWPVNSVLIIGGTLIGFYVSYIKRKELNIPLKIFLSFLMLYSFVLFWKELTLNPYDPRIPLGTLLLYLQTLHSFDLPTRRDLNYSLIVGLVLICVASVMALNSSIAIYYILFLFFASVSLVYNNISRFNQKVQEKKDLPLPFIVMQVAQVSVVIITATLVIFLFLPRFEGLTFRPMPRSWILRLPDFTRGEIKNPGQESSDELKRKGGRELIWNSESYFGFSPYVHLNFRGKLADIEVMKVQSNRWTYLRGLSFDHYDGTGWEITDEENIKEVGKELPPLRLPLDPEILRDFQQSEKVTQIFHIRRELPNIIFGAYQPHLLYFPADKIYVDQNNGLRSPYPLEEGMIYSCTSYFIPLTSREIKNLEILHQQQLKLKKMNIQVLEKYVDGKFYKPEDFHKYLQLPPNLPRRVKSLTDTIIRDSVGEEASYLRKAEAVAEYLRETFPYDLDIPPFPDKEDTVDYFLFEKRRGYCEHFASSLVVMLRTQGVPARLVTGYMPGTYDAVSGFYSIKMSDAHAWVEVYIPGYGWHSLDPTPGYGATYSTRTNTSSFLFLDILKKLNIELPSFNASPFLIIGGIMLIPLGVVFVYITLFYLHKKKIIKNIQPKGITGWIFRQMEMSVDIIKKEFVVFFGEKSENRVFNTYYSMVHELSGKGIIRREGQTPREFLATIPGELIQDAGIIVSAFEKTRYGPLSSQGEEEEKVYRIWNSLKQKIREYRKPPSHR